MPTSTRISSRRQARTSTWPFHAFPDLDTNLRAQVEKIREHPWIKDVPVHGLVYDVESGHLREVH